MKDRRTAKRYEMSLPVIVRPCIDAKVATRTGKTRDLSSQGVYFTIDNDLSAGAQMDLTMILPAQVTGGPEILIQAVAKIVRVDKHCTDDKQPIGVAVVIERYEMVRNEGTKL